MKAKNQTISSDMEAKEKLIVYVYEYLLHSGSRKAAQQFLEEIGYDKNIQASEPPGFLVNWWCVFWDLYCAAPDKRTNQAEPSQEARMFHEFTTHTHRTGLSPQPSPHNHQMMHQQPPPPPPYLRAYGGQPQPPPPHSGQMRGGPGPIIRNMHGSLGPAGPHPQMDQFGHGPGGPPPPHAGGPSLGGPPPNMDGLGRPGPMCPGGSHRPINAPRAQHPNAYAPMGPQRGGPMGGGVGGWQGNSNVNYNVNSQSPAGQPIYGPPQPVTGGGPGTPGIMPSPQGSGPYSPATTAPVRDTTPSSQDGGQGIYMMKNVPSGNPMGQPNFGPMSGPSGMGSMMMPDNMMEPVKSSPASPRPDDYAIPSYDQENDQQSESAEVLKLKQNLQEEAKKLTYDKEQTNEYEQY